MISTGSIILAAATAPELVSVPRTSEFDIPAGAFAGVAAPGAGGLLAIAFTLILIIAVSRWWLELRKKRSSKSLTTPPPSPPPPPPPPSVQKTQDDVHHYTSAFRTTLSLAEIASSVGTLKEFEWSLNERQTRGSMLVGSRIHGRAEQIEVLSLDDGLFGFRFSSRDANPAAAYAYFEVRELIHDLLKARLVISSVDEEIHATHDAERDTLDLKSQGITELPRSVGLLHIHLKKLFLWDNLLTRLPSEIGQLTRLIDLDVAMNCLVELPESINALRELQTLCLTHNNLELLPPAIGELDMLKVFDVGDNRLRRLPPQIGKLSNLRELNVQHNFLTKLPTEVARLNNLKTIYPPKDIKKLVTTRRTLKTYGNPLIDPPQDVAGKGADAVKDYLRTRGRISDPDETRDPNHGITFFASIIDVPDSVDVTLETRLKNAFPELAWQHSRPEATGRRCWGTSPEDPQRLVISLGRMEHNDPFRLLIGLCVSEQANIHDTHRSLLDRVTRALEMQLA